MRCSVAEVRFDVETAPRRKMTAIFGLALLLASIPLIVVYSVLVLSSFSEDMVSGLTGIRGPTLENWILFFEGRLSTIPGRVLSTLDILRFTANTGVVALGVTGVVTATSTLAAYSFSRMRFKGRKFLLQFIILLHAFPGVALIIAVYALYVYLQAYVPQESRVLYAFTYVVIARAALEIPMSIWIMKGFFDKIPWETEWSAIVDGASRVRVWWEIILPQVKPGIAAVAIFSFLAGWEDLIYVLVFLPPTEKTLATYIESLLAEGSLEVVHLPIVAAAGTFYLLPTILFFVFARRLMLETATGGIKA